MPHRPAAPQPLASAAQILSSPSSQDGLPVDIEDDLRVAGCMLIQEAGVMMELPQSTMAIAQVVFHRFFYVSSMLSFGVNDISISSLYVASKLNETPVRLRDLINTYIYLLARIRHLVSLPADQPFPIRPYIGHPSPAGTSRKGKEKAADVDEVWRGFQFEVPGFHDEVFWDWKDVITASEMQILKRLGFNMQVDLPYNHLINYLRILDLVFEDNVAQLCWSVLNDALLTPLFAVYPPHTLACASILLAARLKKIPLPDQWWILFDVAYDDMWASVGRILQLWEYWSISAPKSTGSGADGVVSNRENRWRRAWILSESKRAVRRWIDTQGSSVESEMTLA